jgi:hypothetical protein
MEIAERYQAVRHASLALAEPLSPEDSALQSMEDASPTKWHLAHTSWFFETLVLEEAVAGYTPFHPHFRMLFNSYYNSVGEQYPRPRRGLLSRPDLAEVLAYRRHVDDEMLALLADPAGGGKLDEIVELGLHHEQQHQELILTDIKHALSFNPLEPTYREMPAPEAGKAAALRWIGYDAGIRRIGHDGSSFSFDNERPAHRAFVHAFELASRPVTNGEFRDFMEAGGYRNPELWLSDGWAAVQRGGLPRELLRGRRLRPLGRGAPAHRGGVGVRRRGRPGRKLRGERGAPPPPDPGPGGAAGGALRGCLGVDREPLPGLPRLPPAERRPGRVQREVHERADRAARRLLRDPPHPHPPELSQLLLPRRPLAVQRRPSRPGSGLIPAALQSSSGPPPLPARPTTRDRLRL